MSYQFIIDKASELSLNGAKIIASTTSRSGIVRNVSRGSQPWRIEAKLPDGIRWSALRMDIGKLTGIDRASTSNITINSAGMSYINGYQGDAPNPTALTGSWTLGNTIFSVNNVAGFTGGYKFRAGDFVQLGTAGHVYMVIQDVPATTTDVKVHRPIIDATRTGQAIRVGQNCIFTVLCTQLPSWTIYSYDQVSWTSNFVFTEVII